MITDRHYSPALHSRLLAIISNDCPEDLVSWFGTLSHSQFRTAGYVLAEKVLQECPADRFWPIVNALVTWQPRAFLVTMLNAFLARRRSRSDVSVQDDGFLTLAEFLSHNSEDQRKTLRVLLPAQDDPELVRHLLRVLGLHDSSQWSHHLLSSPSLPCYFVLFGVLPLLEHDTAQLERLTRYLTHQGDSLSFNFACLIRAWYGLPADGATYSLRLQPYQLSRLVSSYPAFCEAMQF